MNPSGAPRVGDGTRLPSARSLSTGLSRLSVYTVMFPPRDACAVLEAPAFRTEPHGPVDLIRYRGIAYDRLCGDIVPSTGPSGYAGAVENGSSVLLSDRAEGLPVAYGPHGWAVSHRQDDGHVAVLSYEDANAESVTWGTSTRSLLGLRGGPSEHVRLWGLGSHVVWLRQEYCPAPTALLRAQDDGPWPQALVTELFDAALCTVMLDAVRLPSLPSGVVVLLDVQQARKISRTAETMVLGMAESPEELSAFLYEDHVNHYLVTFTSDGTCSSSLVGDLPRGSVAHRSLGGQAAVVFTERLETRTTSYRVEDGSVLAIVEARVDHYTGVPGLTGAWVEHDEPHILRWGTGSWTDGTPITHLLEETEGVVTVMTESGQGRQQVLLTPDTSHAQSAAWDELRGLAQQSIGATPPPVQPDAAGNGPVLWCPSAQDPVTGRLGLVLTHQEDGCAEHTGNTVEMVLTEATRAEVPLIWFDDAWGLSTPTDRLCSIDLGVLPPGSAAWCHGGARPVVRVGIDYLRLSVLEPEDVLAELHRAWETAEAVIDDELCCGRRTPFLGGHSFGAALAAVAVLRGACSPAGALLRSGAYDRYMTPHGFEYDRRTPASAPELYRMMSVLSQANAHRGIPFLITCGGADENSATTPQQSVALHENLLAADADTTLAVFPGEGHSFNSRTAILERRRLEHDWMLSRPPLDEPRPTERNPQP